LLGYRKCPATKIISRRDLLPTHSSGLIAVGFCGTINMNHTNPPPVPVEEEKLQSPLNVDCKQRINALLQVCANFDEPSSSIKQSREEEKEGEEGGETKKPASKRQKVTPTVSNDSHGSSSYPSISLSRSGTTITSSSSSSSASSLSSHHSSPYFPYYAYPVSHFPPSSHHPHSSYPSHHDSHNPNIPYPSHMMSFPPPHPVFLPSVPYHPPLPQPTTSYESKQDTREKREKETKDTVKEKEKDHDKEEENQEKMEKQQQQVVSSPPPPPFPFPYYYHHSSYHPSYHPHPHPNYPHYPPSVSFPYPIHPHHLSSLPHPFSYDTTASPNKPESSVTDNAVTASFPPSGHLPHPHPHHPYYSMFPYYLPPSHLTYLRPSSSSQSQSQPHHSLISNSAPSSSSPNATVTSSSSPSSPVKASLSSLTLQMPLSNVISEGSPAASELQDKEVSNVVVVDDDNEKKNWEDISQLESKEGSINKSEILTSFQEISGINLLAAVSTQYLLQETSTSTSTASKTLALANGSLTNVVTPKMQE
jgi:hypothetical protein